MPTVNPRLQITLTPPQHELLKRLAKLQGRSASSVVTELLGEMFPVLERIAVVLQAAVRAKDSMTEGLREATQQAERDTRPFLAGALGQLDLLAMDFERAAGPSANAAVAASRPAAGPRLVTRGSGLPTRAHTNHARAIRRGSKSTKQAAGKPKRSKKS